MWHKTKARLRVSPKEKNAKKCGDEHVRKGREALQMGWYEFASTLVQGKTVLDVGCGSGEGLELLHVKAEQAVGIDLDERLKRKDINIQFKDVSVIPDKSFDVVICIDVIEHVEDDKEFVKHLVRVARELLFVSTPNYAVGRNVHPYHIREYTPYEFECMFSGLGRIRILGGNSRGEIRREIRNKSLYYFLNSLYAYKGTALVAKILKRLLFTRIWPHQAVIVAIDNGS